MFSKKTKNMLSLFCHQKNVSTTTKSEVPAQKDFDKSLQGLLKNFETYQRLNGYWNAVLNSYYFLNEDENGYVELSGTVYDGYERSC